MDKMHHLYCSLTNIPDLYAAYMPFVKGGGLFVRMHPIYQLGTVLKLSIKLMDEPDSYEVEAKVVWITPKGAQANKLSGIGVQFLSENGPYLCDKIENYLAGMLQSPQPTDTV